MDEVGPYTLLLFARRTAVRALRDGDLARARLAVRALTHVDGDVDPRDLAVDLPLYAVGALGGDVGAEIDAAVRTSRAAREAFEGARAWAPGLTLADCALAQITSSYGIGFVDDWSDTPTPAAVALAEATVPLLDEIDAEGTYATSTIAIDDLPGVWFGEDALDLSTRGSVSFSADHHAATGHFSHGLLVFLAELDGPAEAARLAGAADGLGEGGRPQVAVALGSRLVLVVGGSTTVGEDPLETVEGLRRFTALATRTISPG